MNVSDIHVGDEVYHSVFVSFGKGIVVEVADAHFLERVFEKVLGRRRVIVKFEAHNERESRVCPHLLRKKPNAKKIREMIEFYRSRGTTAFEKDGRLHIGEA